MEIYRLSTDDQYDVDLLWLLQACIGPRLEVSKIGKDALFESAMSGETMTQHY